MAALRSTYARIDELQYRLRAACVLLGVTDNTLRTYADNAGIKIMRASDLTPGAPAVRVFSVENLFELAQWRRKQGYIKFPAFENGPAIITVDVIKGGTGKSTTSAELAIHLQLLGLRVLVIDLDIQASATHLFGYEADLTLDEAEGYGLSPDAIVTETFSSVLLPFIDRLRGARPARGDDASISIVKRPFGDAGPHLIPADTFLGDIEQGLSGAKGQRELYIKHLLESSQRGEVPDLNVGDYDVVLFDCPPSANFTSTAALGAANIVIAPIRLDAFSVKGLTKLMHELDGLDKAYSVQPDLVILRTHHAPQFSRIERMQAQLMHYRAFVADNYISASEEFPKSLDNYLPLSLQKPTSNSAKEYRLFAEVIFQKLLDRQNILQKAIS